jgi:membrane-bound lytic murein transglycosylase MltF
MATPGYQESTLDQDAKSQVGAIGVMLMTFAAYNAGPGCIRQLRREAEKQGLDPNVWFGNVERVASARIGRETVTYVSNIYKYSVACKLVVAHRERLAAAKAQAGEGTVSSRSFLAAAFESSCHLLRR